MYNILVSFNKNYLKHFMIMVLSFYEKHKRDEVVFHIVSSDVTNSDIKIFEEMFKKYQFKIYQVNQLDFTIPNSSGEYPTEVYFRLFAATYLPVDLERILYLDVDTIILKSIKKLYNSDFEDNYFLGATSIKSLLMVINSINNKNGKQYLNTGVLLINLELLRSEQDTKELSQYIIKHYQKFFLPDQDVLHALYGRRVGRIDNLIYNLSDSAIVAHNKKTTNKIDNDWVMKNAVIIHYSGKNKPWNKNYRGILKEYYLTYEEKYNEIIKGKELNEK